jgi:hypothetical protein
MRLPADSFILSIASLRVILSPAYSAMRLPSRKRNRGETSLAVKRRLPDTQTIGLLRVAFLISGLTLFKSCSIVSNELVALAGGGTLWLARFRESPQACCALQRGGWLKILLAGIEQFEYAFYH